jgi:photosystem II stability/assembly factor-like uncharacterized protein
MSRIKILILLFIIAVSAFPQNHWITLSTLPQSVSPVYCISAVNSQVIFLCSIGGQVYRSIDGGITWELKNGWITSLNCYTIFALDSLNAWTGTDHGANFRTTDGGKTWIESFPIIGTFTDEIKMFDLNNGICIADPPADGSAFQLRYTTDGGITWIQSPNAPVNGTEYPLTNVWDIIDTSNIWFGTLNNSPTGKTFKVWRTTEGITGKWSSSTVNGKYAIGLCFVNPTDGMLCTSNGQLLKTTDGGVTWDSVNFVQGVHFYPNWLTSAKGGSNIIKIAVQDSNLVTCRIFKTTNLGISWTEELLPAATSVSYIQTVNSNLYFAGSYEWKILKYDNLLSVDPGKSVVSDYSLFQNYPNPFNPSTLIKYSLPGESMVKLTIFNSLGQSVKELTNGIQSSGVHEISFDASGVTSGVYFYNLNAISVDGNQSFRNTRKMILLK